MMKWFLSLFRRKTIEPDLERFHQALVRSVNVQHHDGGQVATDFRRLFMRDPELGKRVLFMLMTWCGEYDNEIPEGRDALNRWAGKQDIAWMIKAALHANIDEMPQPEKTNAETD